MAYNNLLVEKKNGYAIVTVNRPEARNALNAETFKEISQCFDDLRDDEEIRAVIVTGSGDKAFVAGADIKELSVADEAGGIVISRTGQTVFRKIEALPKPVIAAVNGYCLGGGCEFAMACDIRIASEGAKFGQPEVSLGLIPGYGATQKLPRLIGKGKAKALLLTGDMIDSGEALRIGLVDKVVPKDKLMNEAEALATKLAGLAPVALKFMKEIVDSGLDLPLAEALKLEIDRFGKACGTEDKNEGIKAFLDKRKPSFKGK